MVDARPSRSKIVGSKPEPEDRRPRFIRREGPKIGGLQEVTTCVKRERRGKGYNLTTEPKRCQILTVEMICGKTLHLINVCGARFGEVLRACGLRSRAGADSRTSETCNVARVGSSQVTISIALEMQAQLLTSSGQDTWRHCFDCRKGR